MPAQTVIKLRRDTAANWALANPVLAAGEPGLDTDVNQLKLGDGTTEWNDLPYASGAGGRVEVSATAPEDAEEGTIWYDSTIGVPFIYYDDFWVELAPAVAGPQGPAGADGADGADGVDGDAATVDIGTVTTGDPGTSASVVNSGTTSAAVLDFTVPRGEKGDTGDTGPAGANGADGGFDSTQVIESVGTSRALTSADKGKLITNSAAITITVEGLGVGEQVDFLQTNAAAITFAAGAGITLNSKDAKLATAAQYSPASVKCIAANSYVLIGDLG